MHSRVLAIVGIFTVVLASAAAAQDSTATTSAAPTTTSTYSMFSNLANPAIGMNALFSARAAHNLNQPYGPQFDEAEISLISTVDPYWMLSANIVFVPGGVDPEEIWARNTSLPAVQLKLGQLRGTFGDRKSTRLNS